MWCLRFVTLTFCDFYVVSATFSNSYVKWLLRYVMLRFVAVPSHEYENWDWGSAISRKGIHKWNFPCSAERWDYVIWYGYISHLPCKAGGGVMIFSGPYYKLNRIILHWRLWKLALLVSIWVQFSLLEMRSWHDGEGWGSKYLGSEARGSRPTGMGSRSVAKSSGCPQSGIGRVRGHCWFPLHCKKG
jgi:hypothetical protein